MQSYRITDPKSNFWRTSEAQLAYYFNISPAELDAMDYDDYFRWYQNLVFITTKQEAPKKQNI